MVVAHAFSCCRFAQDGGSPPSVVGVVVGATQLCSLLVEVLSFEQVEQESVQVPVSPDEHQKQAEFRQASLFEMGPQSIWLFGAHAENSSPSRVSPPVL